MQLVGLLGWGIGSGFSGVLKDGFDEYFIFVFIFMCQCNDYRICGMSMFVDEMLFTCFGGGYVVQKVKADGASVAHFSGVHV